MGLAHVLPPRALEWGDRGPIVAALAKHSLRNLRSAQSASNKAFRAAQTEEESRLRQAKAQQRHANARTISA